MHPIEQYLTDNAVSVTFDGHFFGLAAFGAPLFVFVGLPEGWVVSVAHHGSDTDYVYVVARRRNGDGTSDYVSSYTVGAR